MCSGLALLISNFATAPATKEALHVALEIWSVNTHCIKPDYPCSLRCLKEAVARPQTVLPSLLGGSGGLSK